MVGNILGWIRGKISENPFKSVLAALAVGYGAAAGMFGALWAYFAK